MNFLCNLLCRQDNPLGSRHQFILIVVFPADNTDDSAVKGLQRFCNPKNIDILFFSVTAGNPRQKAIVDGIVQVDALSHMMKPNGPVNNDRSHLSQIVVAPFFGINNQPGICSS